MKHWITTAFAVLMFNTLPVEAAMIKGVGNAPCSSLLEGLSSSATQWELGYISGALGAYEVVNNLTPPADRYKGIRDKRQKTASVNLGTLTKERILNFNYNYCSAHNSATVAQVSDALLTALNTAQ